MTKSQKELAFLRDLYVGKEWTGRITDLVDKHVRFTDLENLLYINAGTGDHVFAIRDKIGDETAVFATCENEEILKIARDKAAAVAADVDFSMIRFENDVFDAVIADASFVENGELPEFIDDALRVVKPGGTLAAIVITSGSFGEIFSLLWEVLFNEDLGEHGAAAEKLIADQQTVSAVEKMAESAGLVNIKTHTAVENFEFENGAAFVSSPLVADFLLPDWLASLSDDEKERVTEKLAQLIDAEDADLTFLFSVKAMLLMGEKI